MEVWIDIKEKQPEKYQEVIFVAKASGNWEYMNGKPFIGKFQGYSERWGGEFSIPGIGMEGTLWLPLSVLPPIPSVTPFIATLIEHPQLYMGNPPLTLGKSYVVKHKDGSCFVIDDDDGNECTIGSCRFSISK